MRGRREQAAWREAAWREATVFGALWGALEVTFGSFLHVLRVPLSGLILTLTAVILVVAGRQLFPRPGFALRAALICAALKSFSPGGIIIGPMIAIVVEGLLIEGAALLLLRAPALAAMVGGALATLWTILQMLLTRLLLYGLSIFELYLALLRKAADALSLPPDSGWPVLGIFLGILLISGGSAGLLGLRLARQLRPDIKAGEIPLTPASRGIEAAAPLPADLRLVIALLTLILALLLLGDLRATLAALAIAVLGAYRLDIGALRFLGRARFWIASLLIGAGAGALLGEAPIQAWGVPISLAGLTAGAQMVLRSAALLIVLALLARHLPRGRFITLFDRLGLAPLGPAVGVAMGLLPALIEGWRGAARAGRRDPRALFMAVGELLNGAARLAQPTPAIFFITGAPSVGKTQRLEQLAAVARADGHNVGGVLQPRRRVEGERDHYDLVDLRDGHRAPLVHFEAGRAVFEPAGFERAAAAIAEAEGLVIVDELGHLEARGAGHWPSVEARVARGGAVFVFAVARRRVEAFEGRLPGAPEILDLDDPLAAPAPFQAQILKALAALTLLLSLACPQPAWATPSDEAEDAPVIVLGHREAPKSALTVLKGEALRGAAHVGEALEGVEGVEIDIAPKSTHLRLRGFDSRAVLLLIDGVPIDEVYSGALDLSALAVAPIERIEVDRGLTSVLYGPNTLGGVINLYTRAPRRRLEGEAELEAGPLYRGALLGQAARARLGGRLGPAALSLGGSFSRIEGFPLSNEYKTTKQNAEFHENGEIRDNSDGQRYSLNAHATYNPLPGLKISLSANNFDQKRGIPTMESAGYTRIWRFIEYTTRTLSVSARYHPDTTPRWAFQGVEAHAWISDHQDHLIDCEDLDCARLTTDTKAWFVESRWENEARGGGLTPRFALWEGQELALNLSGRREEHTEREIRPTAGAVNESWSPPSYFSSQTLNLAAESTQRWGGWRWVLGGGISDLTLLSEAHRDKNYPVSDRALRASDGRLFIDYSFAGGRLLGAVGHKTRYPTLKELFSNSVGGNPTLEAERAWMYELGLEGVLLGLGLHGRVFYSQVEDLIDRAESAYANVAEATLAGVELGLESAPRARVGLQLGYTHLYSHDARADRPLDRRTPHTLSAVGRATWGQTDLKISALMRAGQRSIFYDPARYAWRDDEVPASLLIGARVQHTLLKGRVYTYLDGRNLLDEDYQTGGFAPQPGRRVVAGLGGVL
ncbi:TonB-dependent receptor [Myxococcota bacterium]|nr:TonB-dependent receptor [Myxococcota bacterium]